jgi:hypothetical protein
MQCSDRGSRQEIRIETFGRVLVCRLGLAHNQSLEGAVILRSKMSTFLLMLKSPIAIADNHLNRLNLSAAGFAHADSPDLFGDVVLCANNLERSAAADGADEAAFAAGAFVVTIECVR